jgi:hypothetical protein
MGLATRSSEELISYPHISTFLQVKDKIESYIKAIYHGRAEGNNFGIRVDVYAEVGGFEEDYYYYWSFSAKILDLGFSLGFSRSLVKQNMRKLIKNAKNLKDGNLYLYDWNKLVSQSNINADFTQKDLDVLIDQQIRGIIAFQMLMNIYIQPSYLQNKQSIEFIGEELTNKIGKYIHRTREIFPKTIFNSYYHYYSPCCHLFFVFGKEIMKKLSIRFPETKFVYSYPDSFKSVINSQSPFWQKELIYSTFCRTYSEDVGKYFGSWF